MSIFEYNKEEEERKLRKAEYEAGYDSGYDLGRKIGERWCVQCLHRVKQLRKLLNTQDILFRK